MAALRTLVAQAEATKPHGDRWWFGYEIFEFNGQFRLVIHTSTYDGVKRDSHYAIPEQPMEALTREDALSEAARTTAAYARAVTGVEG